MDRPDPPHRRRLCIRLDRHQKRHNSLRRLGLWRLGFELAFAFFCLVVGDETAFKAQGILCERHAVMYATKENVVCFFCGFPIDKSMESIYQQRLSQRHVQVNVAKSQSIWKIQMFCYIEQAKFAAKKKKGLIFCNNQQYQTRHVAPGVFQRKDRRQAKIDSQEYSCRCLFEKSLDRVLFSIRCKKNLLQPGIELFPDGNSRNWQIINYTGQEI
jgi:hypothetical protein